MIRLSFILPCFKVELYVEHCLRSILNCGLSDNDYEIICCDDGHLDATSDIIHQFANIYSQIRIIDANNTSVGESRNMAISLAHGTYVWFVDSDDAIISVNVKPLLEQVENNNLDVLAFNFDRLNEEHQLISESRVFLNSSVMNGISFVKQLLGDMLYLNIGYVWRFIYRLDYLKTNNLFFPEGVSWEDTVYTPKSMIEAKRIQSSSLMGYHYYFHHSSVCRVMERKYPGNLIFDYVFRAGADLLAYSKTIKDDQLSMGLVRFSLKTYFNRNFMLYMLRTTRKERILFYKLVKNNRHIVDLNVNNVNGICILFMLPVVGPVLANFASMIYKITH